MSDEIATVYRYRSGDEHAVLLGGDAPLLDQYLKSPLFVVEMDVTDRGGLRERTADEVGR